ncbi:MAG: hypothetical protein ACXVDK_17755, partial [Bacteroidia bacterium]
MLALCALGSNMFLGEVPTSIPQIVIGANWFLEGRFREKLKVFFSSRLLWALSSLFILHLIGMLYTSETARGLEDLRIKMPLLFIPMLLLSTDPLTKRELRAVFYFCIAGALASSFWCLFYYTNHPYIDPRNASRFISHIRYGLMLNMTLCIIGWLIYEEEHKFMRLWLALAGLYLIFFMVKISL